MEIRKEFIGITGGLFFGRKEDAALVTDRDAMDAFLRKAQRCTRFADIKNIWDTVVISDEKLKESVTEKLSFKLAYENYYGATSETKIKKFCDEMRSVGC